MGGGGIGGKGLGRGHVIGGGDSIEGGEGNVVRGGEGLGRGHVIGEGEGLGEDM